MDVAALLDEISLKDFVSDVMNRFGLFINMVDEDAKVFEFKQLEGILKTRSNAIDWTSKLNGIPKNSYLPDVAQSNIFSFQYPDDATQLNARDSSILIDNFNLEYEADFYSSPFEIAQISGLYLGERTYNIELFSVDDDGEISEEETPAKLMKVTKYNGSITIGYFSETVQPFTGEIPYLSLDKIDMAYYIAKSYNQYTLLLNSYKAVSMPLNLTPIDVYSLTFDKLYFFSQLGRYYFLDSIRYSPGTIAEGNFVEVPEFATNAAPESIGVYNLTIGFSSSRSVSLQDITGSFYDPEFDAPAKVKIVSGFNSELLIYQNGTLLTGETEINAQDLNLSFTDTGASTNERNYSFAFNIADAGSGLYAEQNGTINFNVKEYDARKPSADAGSDYSLPITTNTGTDYFFGALDSSGTYSTDAVSAYNWTLISSPSGSDPIIAQKGNNFSLRVPGESASFGVYTIQLEVVTVYGETDTDTVEITVYNDNIETDPGGGGLEPNDPDSDQGSNPNGGGDGDDLPPKDDNDLSENN